MIQHYQKWANDLYPYLPFVDFARTAENELSNDSRKSALLQYRVQHLRREGVFKTEEEKERERRADENRQKALEKRRQREEAQREPERVGA